VVIVAKVAAIRPTDVTGAEHEGIEIVSGLTEGQEVVVSGQFLIDSESMLRTALGRLAPPEAEVPPLEPEKSPHDHTSPTGTQTGEPK
jgi:Cu(I)/Ag(I) efflux system membrane fusion protein